MATCPACGGAKTVSGIACGPAGCKPATYPCFTCKGAGEVADVMIVWREYGEMLKAFRRARNISTKEAATMAGVRPIEWNDAEHGKVDPVPLLAKIQRLLRAEWSGA